MTDPQRDGHVAEIVQLGAEPRIELLYFDGCPNHEAFLPHLRQLLVDRGVTTPVTLIRLDSDDEAQRRQFLGSPTLRINGLDVESGAAARHTYGLQCRIYLTADGMTGAPPDSLILDALAANAANAAPIAAVDAVRTGEA